MNYKKLANLTISILGAALLSPVAFGTYERSSEMLIAQADFDEGAGAPSHVGEKSSPQKTKGQKGKNRTKKKGLGGQNSDANSEKLDDSTDSTKPNSSYLARTPHGLAVGLELGWEARYGNGPVLHFLPTSLIDIHGGLGYTQSGIRVGGGGGLNIFLGRSFAMSFGASISHTTGSSGEVSLIAKFTPEGQSTNEDVVASKNYEISSSQALTPYAGAMFELFKGFYLKGIVNYNVIVGGNLVTLKDQVRFDKDIVSTNQDSFEEEFNDKAKERAAAGGMGFSVGGTMFL